MLVIKKSTKKTRNEPVCLTISKKQYLPHKYACEGNS